MGGFFSFFLTVFLLTISPLQAAVYKGQKIFLKECVKCHKSTQDFVAKKNIAEWKMLMEKKGKPLADLHLKSKKAKESWEYFKSKKYYKKSKHLKHFLVEYAKDSGKIPALN